MNRFKSILLLTFILACSHAYAANPLVEIRTNIGTITLELYPNKAPKTVDNFLQYAREGAYNKTVFHRVIKGFMIQGGGYDIKLAKKPTRAPIDNEAGNGLKNERYTIAMARTSNPHSASNQFFINVANNEFLNYRGPNVDEFGYCVFGKVVKGMDVVENIASVKTGRSGSFPSDVPQIPVVIEFVTVIIN